jgi:hypothetical protein
MFLSKSDVIKIKSKYPGSVPILVKRDSKFKYQWYCKTEKDTVKMLAPESMTMFDLRLNILGRLRALNNTVSDTIYLSCGNTIIACNNMPISYYADKYGAEGALYMGLHNENAFG